MSAAVHVRQPRRRAGNRPPDGARGFPALGPGASRRPGGQFLAEQARGRKSSPTFRKTWCTKADCPGHVQERQGVVMVAQDEGRCA